MRYKSEKMAESEKAACSCCLFVKLSRKQPTDRLFYGCTGYLFTPIAGTFYAMAAVNILTCRHCKTVRKPDYSTLYRYLLSLWITLCIFCKGNSQQIDSLLQLLNNPGLPDTVRINTNNSISRQLSFIKPIEALHYTQKAMELSQKINYKRGTAESYRNLGSIYAYYGSYYLTVFNLQKAIDGYKELNDSIGLANCYISMGHMYRYLRNVPQEIAYHQLSYDMHSRLGNPERIGVTSHNLGESYYNNRQLDKAKALTIKAMGINSSIKNVQVLSSCYKVMGKILMAENNTQEAEVYFKKILSIYDSLKDNSQKIATIEAFIQLAAIYKQRNNITEEERYLRDAADFVSTYKLTNYTRQIYLDLIELYTQTNRKNKALEYTSKYRIVSDSLAKLESQEKNQLVANFTKLYQVEKENNILAFENKLQDERGKRKNVILYFIGSFSIVTIILLVLLVRNINKIRSTNEQLEQKNMIIESQNEKLEELNETKDKFFGIVSHDLRAPLSAVSSFTDLLQTGQLKNLPEDQMNELVTESKSLIDNARKLTDDLITWAQLQMKKEEAHPTLFTAAEVVNNVMTVFKDAAAQKQITINHTIDPELQLYADKNQYTFIIRNLINNAVKFTPAGGAVTITGASNNNSTTVSITDTGIGMSKDVSDSIFRVGKLKSKNGTAGEKGTGLGLILVQEFVHLNNGEIKISSEPGRGSTFSVSVPATAE